MTRLTMRENKYIQLSIPKDRIGDRPYSNEDRASIVGMAKDLHTAKAPAFGIERSVLYNQLYRELKVINYHWIHKV